MKSSWLTKLVVWQCEYWKIACVSNQWSTCMPIGQHDLEILRVLVVSSELNCSAIMSFTVLSVAASLLAHLNTFLHWLRNKIVRCYCCLLHSLFLQVHHVWVDGKECYSQDVLFSLICSRMAKGRCLLHTEDKWGNLMTPQTKELHSVFAANLEGVNAFKLLKVMGWS